MSRTDRFALMVALALGVLVRTLPVIAAPAALGDGGFILAMVDDLRVNGLVPPAETTYNGLGIPFVYPPLALLLAAAIGEVGGIATLDLLRWMPLVVSLLVLGAVAWLAWRALPPRAAIGATFAYALMPHAYDWVIAGGGLTRGLGLLFAVSACGIVARRSDPSARSAIVAGILLGLSLLAHPQAWVLGVIGCVALSVERPLRPWVGRAALAMATAVLVAAPWLVGTLAAHGTDAFLSAGHRLEPAVGLLRMLNLHFSGAPFMDLFAVAGAVGLLVAVARRDLRVPAMLIGTYAVGAGGGHFIGAVPWALLAGIGGAAILDLVEVALSSAGARPRRMATAVIAGVVLWATLVASVGSAADESSKLHRISAEQVAAMRWLADNAPAGTRVIAPAHDVWGNDELSEWLPAIGHVESIGTVQGAEWLGAEGFEDRLRTHVAVLDCAGSTARCYREIDPTAWLFIPKGSVGDPFAPAECCPAVRETLAEAGYLVVHDGAGATIARPGD